MCVLKEEKLYIKNKNWQKELVEDSWDDNLGMENLFSM